MDATLFFRISRAALVRLDAIVEVAPRLHVCRRPLRQLLARLEGAADRF